MKNEPKLIKYQNLAQPDVVFYAFSNWHTKEIDGVTFLSVVKNPPSHNTQITHWIRKDSLKRV
jgi:hypothetical protein